MQPLAERLAAQSLSNGYQLVDGEAMHAENGDRFQIPHPLLKKHVAAGQFVELRIDSPRFSAHPGAPDNCTCPHCNEEATKPVLSHSQPATLLPLPSQNVPSRGWGEDFWVRVNRREGDAFEGVVDNPLVEARLHGLKRGSTIYFSVEHILAIHDMHREELVLSMDQDELKEFAQWLGSLRR